MKIATKKILIADERGFSRICAAILQKEGFDTIVINDFNQITKERAGSDCGLIITSYPFAEEVLQNIREMNIPTILLSDRLNGYLTRIMENFGTAFFYCMIKPVDYVKFRALVKRIMRPEVVSVHQCVEVNATATAKNMVAQS